MSMYVLALQVVSTINSLLGILCSNLLFVFRPAMAIIRVTASVTYTTSLFGKQAPPGKGTNGVVRSLAKLPGTAELVT
jgi:hypothetical protein